MTNPLSSSHQVSDLEFIFAGVEGIEPTLSVLETDVLPLNYTPNYQDRSLDNETT